VSPGWTYAIDGAVVEFLIGYRPANRIRAVRVMHRLVDDPAVRPDGFVYDDTGRRISIVRLNGLRVHYWIDHFAKQVRITDIAMA
jgi:YD repeat-containing protein